MPRVTFWISTNKVGSECKCTVDVEEDDINDDALQEIGMDVIWNMAEWGWRIENSE